MSEIDESAELEQHIKNFKEMYKTEMRMARAKSQYLLDGINRAKSRIQEIKTSGGIDAMSWDIRPGSRPCERPKGKQ